MYLRKMGSVSLLTREGEVEIAKRIEDGERRCSRPCSTARSRSRSCSRSASACAAARSGSRTSSRTRRDEAEFNEQFYVDRVCKIIDKVRKLQRDTEKLERS